MIHHSMANYNRLHRLFCGLVVLAKQLLSCIPVDHGCSVGLCNLIGLLILYSVQMTKPATSITFSGLFYPN